VTADIETAARPVTERADFADVVAAIAARAAEHDRDASFPHEAFTELHRVGVLNLTVPAELGGGGATLAETVEVIRAVGAADPSVALVLAMHLIAHAGLGRPDNPWPKEVRRRVQRSSLAGVALINALRVEPELGTPARGGLPATVAERTDDGWVLRGHKIYYDGETWRYADTHAPADDSRPCARCGEMPTPEGYDPCIGYVPGAVSVCCGHGVAEPICVMEEGSRCAS